MTKKPFYPFPKIQSFDKMVYELHSRLEWMESPPDGVQAPVPETLKFIGTPKIHGTNAAIVLRPDGTVYFQSRTRVITADSDNAGFVKAMEALDPKALVNALRMMTLDLPSFNGDDIIVYGEWCGPGIQKNVGVSHLKTKTFVAFATAVGKAGKGSGGWHLPGCWDWEEYPESIASITNFTTWGFSLPFRRPHEAAERIEKLTLEVEAECPVAMQLANVSGIGEGIVWMCQTEGFNSSKYWFKSKGEKHKGSPRNRKTNVSKGACPKALAFVAEHVTLERLERSLSYLDEQGLPRAKSSIGPLLRWAVPDFMEEVGFKLEGTDIDPRTVRKTAGRAFAKYAARELS